jgi:2-oxoglutarate ferredoxin oxidoreductase subunit delta
MFSQKHFCLKKYQMKTRSKNDSFRTAYIQLNTKKCIACWECLKECKNNVIGRIDLPWHKHSRFVNSYECTGCFKCLNVCEPGALTKNVNNMIVPNSLHEKMKLTFIVNIGLLILALRCQCPDL